MIMLMTKVRLLKWELDSRGPIYFDQVRYQTPNAFIGNKHFSPSNDLARLTKCMNNLVKDLILTSELTSGLYMS